MPGPLTDQWLLIVFSSPACDLIWSRCHTAFPLWYLLSDFLRRTEKTAQLSQRPFVALIVLGVKVFIAHKSFLSAQERVYAGSLSPSAPPSLSLIFKAMT